MVDWINSSTRNSKNYICGHCGNNISSEKGYGERNSGDYIYICHKCGKPTYFNKLGDQIPGALFGKHFDVAIPQLVKDLYEEARRCYSVNAFTSVGMCCRKLLMHIAVDNGANPGLKFIEYIDFLDFENYIPKKSKKWVDIIRTKGNEANHEIVLLNKNDAEQLITFSSIIINLIYENELLLCGAKSGA